MTVTPAAVTHPLDGPRRKVRRAREHVETIRFLQGRFFEEDAFEIFSEPVEGEAGQHVFRVRVHKALPRHRFAAVVGDCVHNLRSALDHLTWLLSEDFGGPNDGDTATQFPIFRTEAGYRSRGLGQIRRVGPGAAAVIEQLQPFQDDKPDLSPLWLVRDLDNRDKHRDLAVAAVVARTYRQRLYGPEGQRGTFRVAVSKQEVQDGAVIAELAIQPPDARVRVEADFEFQVALRPPSVPVTDVPLFAVRFLTHLADVVDAAIDCFVPFYTTGRYEDAAVISDPLAPVRRVRSSPSGESPPTDIEDDQWHRVWSDGAVAVMNADVAAIAAASAEGVAGATALKEAWTQGFVTGASMATERVTANIEGLLPTAELKGR